MIKWLFVFLLAAILSCKDSDPRPAGLIPKEKMELLFWDYLRAETFTVEFLRIDSIIRDDTLQNLDMQQQIFALHGVNRKQFYESYEYYKNHPAEMIEIIDSMVATQQRLKPNNGLAEFY
jgi:hypothetical protein